MKRSDFIRQAREALDLTQEDLAEKLEVSRQAVSKWELGASVPSQENLKLLEEILGIEFPAPETAPSEKTGPEAGPKAPFWNWKRVMLLVLGILVVSALLSIGLFHAVHPGKNADAPRPSEPVITGVSFFDERGAELTPKLTASRLHIVPGSRVILVLEFEDGAESHIHTASASLAPGEAEEPVWEQGRKIPDGQDLALFILDIPQDLESRDYSLRLALECYGKPQALDLTIRITDISND